MKIKKTHKKWYFQMPPQEKDFASAELSMYVLPDSQVINEPNVYTMTDALLKLKKK